MVAPSYLLPGLVLSSSAAFSPQVLDLQRDLRSLGYAKGPIDGIYGAGTANSVEALQYDLQHNDGSSSGGDGDAPVAVKGYNKGSITTMTGILEQSLAACIVEMLNDPAYPKLPSSADPATENANAIAAVKAMTPCSVPVPFLIAVLKQESGCLHYRVPEGANTDSFVTVGLDHNIAAAPTAITSRGYGIGQFTLFHHPPTAAEVQSVIIDPVKNVQHAVSKLVDKFSHYVAGTMSVTQSDDRIAEFGKGLLRSCRYPSTDPRYMSDCSSCLNAAGTINIQSGITPFFSGSEDTYEQTQYHGGNYRDVPVRSNIPCDWPYAVRRYNGSGPNSYDYQAEVLLRVVGRPI